MSDSKKKNKRASTDPLARDLSPLLQNASWQKVRFELKPKDRVVTIRVSEDLLNAIKDAAEKRGVNYQKWIRLLLEEGLDRAS